MSNLINMEFVQALNPLYAFPIVAVIICVFIVYAFGFKSPVQPPSFDGIEEEKKVSKKRKPKDTNKGKAIQNGKLNGSTTNKAQIQTPGKKKDVEKPVSSDKPIVERTSANEKKGTKKAKQQNEKKNNQVKKKESISHDDTGEDGWVQLVSKKGRKSRKKDEASSTENQSIMAKSVKSAESSKSEESSPSEEHPKKVDEIVVESSIPEEKQIKEDKNSDIEVVSNIENKKEKPVVVEDAISNINSMEKMPSRENLLKIGSLIEETSTKSKKKKKKHVEVMNVEITPAPILSEPPAVQVVSEPASPQNATIDSAAIPETPQVISSKIEVNQPKESKSSNVVFDELTGLFPEPKEPRKKKKVRRDH